MNIYLIEHKTFYTNSDGIDYQVADMGTLPRIYSSKKKAIAKAERMADFFRSIQSLSGHHDIEIDDNPLYPAIRQITLHNKAAQIRQYVTVYEKELNQ